MAFDISLDDDSEVETTPKAAFADFCNTNAERLGRAMALVCQDDAVAAKALTDAFTKASQRSRQLIDHPHQTGWVFETALASAEDQMSDRPALAMNEATGGYVRGLGLLDAIAALPLRQRGALVGAYFLGWSDDQASRGNATASQTITTRRTRALTFLAHHLRVDSDEVADRLTEHFAAQALGIEPHVLDPVAVQRSARRRNLRNRVVIIAAALAIIVAVAALLNPGRSEAPVAQGPPRVSPPTNTSNWFHPVSDGQGDFIALDTSGASQFVRSETGEVWFDDQRWNSRAIDLRSQVTGFSRSGGTYVATIEAPSRFRDFVPPRIATSTDLANWTVREMDLDPLPEGDGIRSRYDVLAVAVADDQQLVTFRVEDVIDYRQLGVAADDVCVEETAPTEITLHLCAGEVISIERSLETTESEVWAAVSTGNGPYEIFPAMALIDPRSITAVGSGFAAVDGASGDVWFSDDGRDWFVGAPTPQANRFVLAQGDSRAQTMIIQPSAEAWTSILIEADGSQVTGTIPLEVDPATVWTEPDMAVGPAGWALYVTTSRPWERVGATSGFAVDTGDWVVSQLPDAETIAARSADGATTFRFDASSVFVKYAFDGGIALLQRDESGELDLLVSVPATLIEASRVEQDTAQAHVFFSDDGTEWRTVWSSDKDTWFGTLAVGDDEVLLTGAQLTGTPLTISLVE